jgi:DNA-binding transcriptional regulator YiaG
MAIKKWEKEILEGLKAAQAHTRGEKVKGFTRFVRKAPVTRSEVQQVRKLTHTTQEGFAETIGVSVRLVQAWEQGWRKPEPLPSKVIRAIKANPKFAAVLAAC